MVEYYNWFVLLHVVGLVLFAAGHGIAVMVAFRVRAATDRGQVIGGLAASTAAFPMTYIGLLLLVAGGSAAAQAGNLWGQGWVIASIVVLVVVLAAMYGVASPYYGRLRHAVGLPSRGNPPPGPPVSPEELAQLLQTRRPELLLAIGGVGLLVLLWLMVIKPT